MKIKDLKKSRVGIFWMGREGKSSMQFLLNLGKKEFTLFDNQEDFLYELIEILVDLESTLDFEVKKEKSYYKGKVKLLYKKKRINISFFFWDFDASLFHEYDAIIKTPWISPYDERYTAYRHIFISQTAIFRDNYKGKIIGITGTKGKSTISTLIYEALKKAEFDVKLVGNIGRPVLDQVDILGKKKYDFIVYEMSSYMLEETAPKNYISILNNIYTCHVDWHKNFENYEKAKARILSSAKYAFINYELKDLEVVKNVEKNIVFHFGEKWDYSYKKWKFYKGSKKIMDDEWILLKWDHNRRNISAVIGVLDRILKDKKEVKNVLKPLLKQFSGLPHRLENIGVYKDIIFINDAIASAPESTIEAMKTFSWEIGTLFLWWQDSGFNFTALRERIIQEKIENLVLFPDTGTKIFPEAEEIQEEKEFFMEIGNYGVQVIKTRSMKRAVDFAYRHTKAWKIALLSCWAPSFSLWKNYEEKWNLFREAVKNF